MKTQMGPWRRSLIKAGEGQAPMAYEGLTSVPYLTASAASTGNLAASLSKPIAVGTITFYLEKNGTVTDQVTLTAGQSYKNFDIPNRSFADQTRFRLLMSTSSDLTPLDLDALAWLVTSS